MNQTIARTRRDEPEQDKLGEHDDRERERAGGERRLDFVQSVRHGELRQDGGALGGKFAGGLPIQRRRPQIGQMRMPCADIESASPLSR